MPTTRLTLIAHTATAALRAARFPHDEPIDDAGLRSAEGLRPRMSRADTVLCGPELRTQQTSAALGLHAVIDERLADCHFGRWQGQALEAVNAAEPDAVATWLGDPSAAPHGGESVVDLLNRASTWLAAMVDVEDQNDRHRIIAVTHPSIVRSVVVAAVDAKPESFWRIDIPPMGITTLHHQTGRWTLRSLNATTADPVD